MLGENKSTLTYCTPPYVGYIEWVNSNTAIDFASATRTSLPAMHLELSVTMAEMCECDLEVVGPRALAAGYVLGVPGITRPVSLKCWLSRAARGERVYGVRA